MSMKKTDLYKNLAKKLDRERKAEATPARFGKKAVAPDASAASPAARPAKPVQLICRLPADLVQQMRQQALQHEGGMSALVEAAVKAYLPAAKQVAVKKAAVTKTTAKKAATKKATTVKVAAKKAPAKKVAAKKVAAKPAPMKKAPAKKATVKGKRA